MPISPQARRAAERRQESNTAALKAEYRAKIERIQGCFTPALSNAELSQGLELGAAPEGQAGGSSIGRYVSYSNRSRNAIPDRFLRALLDRICDGGCLVAVEPPVVPGARRQVLICEPGEVVRLGTDWAVVNVAGGPVPEREVDIDWDDDDLFDPLAEKPARPAQRRTGPIVVPRAPPSAGNLRPPVVRSDGRVAPRRVAGHRVSAVGLGAMRLSTAGRPSRADALAVLRAALDAGTTLVDTADSYALDDTDLHHNEALVAEALGGRRDVLVATKVGLTRPGGRWIPNGRPEALRARCEESLAALGVDTIDLVQLHVVDRQVPFEDSLGALVALRDAGTVRAIGVCNATAEQIDIAVDLAGIVSVQNRLNPWDKTAITGGALAACHRHGLAFLAYAPIAGHARAARVWDDAVLTEVALELDATPQQVVLAWLLTLGPGIVPIPGATRIQSATGSAAALDRLDAAFPIHAAVRRDTWGTAADDREITVVMGIPAAGKTSAVAPFVARGDRRLNRDDLGGKLDDLLPHLEGGILDGVGRFVLDNTYPTVKTRRGVLDIAARYAIPATCLWLRTALADAQVNACQRLLRRYDGRLPSPEELANATEANTFPPIAQYRYDKLLEPPATDEGFREVRPIPFVRTRDPEYQNRALLLDMDGTVRTTVSGRPYPGHPDDVRLLAGRAEVLRAHHADGWRLLGLSNQSGIARGDVDHAAVQACFERVSELVGVEIPVVYCPHPSGRVQCWCRKPMPGLAVQLIEAYKLDPGRCLMVGDQDTDRQCAEAAGVPYVDQAEFFGS